MSFILGIPAFQHVTMVHTPDSATEMIISLINPSVIPNDPPPSKYTNSKIKLFTSYKNETWIERSIHVGILAANNYFQNDFLSSQPISHSSFSQKNDVSIKGQMASAGDNTLFTDVISLASDPRHLLSITAPAVNISLQSQGKIQAATSVFDDFSAKTQADDNEKTTNPLPDNQTTATAFYAIIKGEIFSGVADVTKRMLQVSRGRKCKQKPMLLIHQITDTWKSYHHYTL